MRKSPMNYIITLAAGGMLWVLSAVLLGSLLGDNISLARLSVEDFLVRYRMALGIATVSGILNLFYWFYYGGKESTAGEPDNAKKIYNISFVSQIFMASAIVIALVLMLMGEGIESMYYIVIFMQASLQTFTFFWLCSFLMSPVNVEYIPYFKR